MFTGIIEEVGKIRSIGNGRVEILAQKVLEGTKIGDSIAVDGVCLTVTKISTGVFFADVMNETLSRSSLGSLSSGSSVNLERAMAADGRFGGHFVSGHIDGTGKISELRKDGNAVWVEVSTSGRILSLIVEKGSVAIDGISLTVADVNPGGFSVSVIPHTGGETTLLGKKVGDTVNLENDIVAKYVRRFVLGNDAERIGKENRLLDWLSGKS